MPEPPDDVARRLKRRLLLRRFWQSAAGYWGKDGARLSWVLPGLILLTVLLNLAAAYGMNVWNRAIFDALEKRDGATVLFLTLIYFPLLVGKRAADRHAGLRAHDDAAALARLAEQPPARPLAAPRPLLSAQSHQRGSQEPGIPHRRRRARRHRCPVDFATGVLNAVLLAATFIGVLWAVGGALSVELGGVARHDSGLPGDRGGALYAGRQRLDDFHRPQARQRRRTEEPGRGGIPLRAHAAARERREHRGAGRRGRRSGARSTAR